MAEDKDTDPKDSDSKGSKAESKSESPKKKDRVEFAQPDSICVKDGRCVRYGGTPESCPILYNCYLVVGPEGAANLGSCSSKKLAE